MLVESSMKPMPDILTIAHSMVTPHMPVMVIIQVVLILCMMACV